MQRVLSAASHEGAAAGALARRLRSAPDAAALRAGLEGYYLGGARAPSAPLHWHPLAAAVRRLCELSGPLAAFGLLSDAWGPLPSRYRTHAPPLPSLLALPARQGALLAPAAGPLQALLEGAGRCSARMDAESRTHGSDLALLFALLTPRAPGKAGTCSANMASARPSSTVVGGRSVAR